MGGFIPLIRQTLISHPPPHLLIVGNSIGTMSLRQLQGFMKRSLAAFHSRLPRTKIVWSQFLQRSYWRHMFSSFAAERSRTRINSSLAKFAIHTLHGAYISYPPLNPYNPSLYYDGVHLHPHANDTFLETLQQALIHSLWSGKSLPPY